MSEYIIEMLHITKEFPGIIANDDITLQLRKGEIHALLGENGAGKSTLMSVLFGMYQPEKGEIRKNGQVVQIRDPNDANALGIGMVHQHFKLVDVFRCWTTSSSAWSRRPRPSAFCKRRRRVRR
ncbi:MAG: ATP-binding cassette domain-containing protein [Christensenellales bacterium]|nr:ATP-binding cassette domain-containing protein [Christensenellales bacterium]